MENERLYSFGELKKHKVYPILLKYLEIEIVKKGRASYITQKSFDKVMRFKSEHPDTKVIMQKYSFKKKYGVENPQQLKKIHDKTKRTNLEKYGCENPSQSEEIKRKKIETLQNHYGKDVTNSMHSKEVVDKVKKNWANKTRDEIDSFTAKNKSTKKERYGDENYNNGEKISETRLARTQEEINKEVEKMKSTKKERYGDENYNNRNQITLTMIEKYGKGSNTNSKKAMKTKIKNGTVVCKANYLYKGMKFASSWEIYYYIYHKEILHSNIQKGKCFEYRHNGHLHIYECDFEVNGENVEIKGNQYLDENDKLHFPYSDYKEIKSKEMQKLWESKQKCMTENNVRVVSKNEIDPIIKIVKEKFGKDYVCQFRKIKKSV